MTEEELNARLVWSSAGGKHAQTRAIVEFIVEQSGRRYAAHDDAAAKTLRELASVLRQWEITARQQLVEAQYQVEKLKADRPGPEKE